MGADTSGPSTGVILVAAFGSLPDAELAARFLRDRGVPTTAIPLGGPDQASADRPELRRTLGRPLAYAAFGAVLFGIVGTVLWSVFLPGFLTPAWWIATTVLCGGSAAGSVGRLVDQGLDPGSSRPGGPVAGDAPLPGRQDRALLAVEAGQVDSATRLLRRIGADRILVRDPPR